MDKERRRELEYDLLRLKSDDLEKSDDERNVDVPPNVFEGSTLLDSVITLDLVNILLPDKKEVYPFIVLVDENPLVRLKSTELENGKEAIYTLVIVQDLDAEITLEELHCTVAAIFSVAEKPFD